MGSLNDIVLPRSGGSGATVRADAIDNERFEKLRSEIYILAMKLKSEEY